MLSACAASRAIEPARAADPIVERKVERVPVCPAEVTAPAPPRVAPYEGAGIEAPQGYFDWLSAHLAREALLGARLADAKGQCPA